MLQWNVELTSDLAKVRQDCAEYFRTGARVTGQLNQLIRASERTPREHAAACWLEEQRSSHPAMPLNAYLDRIDNALMEASKDG